jgi:hypothetical protein
MLVEKAVHVLPRTHVALDAGHGAADDGLQPLYGERLAVAEVVEQHHLMPGLDQYRGGVQPDVTGAAGEQNHFASPCMDAGILAALMAAITNPESATACHR